MHADTTCCAHMLVASVRLQSNGSFCSLTPCAIQWGTALPVCTGTLFVCSACKPTSASVLTYHYASGTFFTGT